MKNLKLNAFIILSAIVGVSGASAQTGRNVAPRVQISFDRFYDHAQITAELQRLVAAWPEFLIDSRVACCRFPLHAPCLIFHATCYALLTSQRNILHVRPLQNFLL